MRGFAVAAGGWDEVEEPPAPPLSLVEPEVAPVEPEPEHAAVVDLAEHRERLASPSPVDATIILAW